MNVCFQFRRLRLTTAGQQFALIIAALSCALPGHAQTGTRTATLYGSVRNQQGKPIAAAKLQLQFDNKAQSRVTQSDAQGEYRFSSLHPGVYSLKAEIAGYRKAEITSIFLADKESKAFDVTLEPAASPATPASAPEFFDPPKFTISGVSDTTSLGGHGSDTVVRTRDAIAKETASLGKPTSGQPAPDSTEETLRRQVEREPGNVEANHALGQLLVQHRKDREAIPYLKHAAELDPKNDDNTFDLAVAYCRTGDYAQARAIAEPLASRHDTAQNHHVLADIQEKSGNSLAAVGEYQRAAELDPSEPNLFDWGSELLLHHAPEPAQQVFATAAQLFPRSTRILIGLGASEFATGSYDKAVEELCAASDVNADDPTPYLFLGKIEQVEDISSAELVDRLHRFVTLHPDSAQANYNYAVALWKRRKVQASDEASLQIQSLLNQAVRLDPNFGEAYLQQGVLYAEQRQFTKAISEFQHAVKVSPGLEEAHYRLAQAYRETGQTDQARSELLEYQRLEAAAAQKEERERHEIRQFVYTLRDPSSNQPR